MTTLRKELRVDNVLTEFDTVVLADSGDIYGIKRADNDVVVVAKDTAMTEESTGIYIHEFTDPAFDLTYDYSIKATLNGVDYYITGQGIGPTLVTTAGGACYVSMQEMADFFAARVDATWYDSSTAAERFNAALQATKIIDRLKFEYDKTADDQELEFPRNDETEIPQAIKDACCLIAFELMAGKNTNIDYESLRVITESYARIRSVSDTNMPMEHTQYGIPSREAWVLLKPYLINGETITLHRV